MNNPPVPYQLRPYQQKGLDDLAGSKERCVILHAPTGAGKTLLAAEITRAARQEGMSVMLMAPRNELIGQFCEKLDHYFTMGYGLITADRGQQHIYEPVQVASVDTLVSRLVRRKNMMLPTADVVICDEVHLYITAQRLQLLALYPNARIIGLSATPARQDGKALGALFERIIPISNVRDLTEQGFLAPANYYAPSRPDLERIRVVRGDYEEKGVQEAMQPLLGDIVGHWLKHAATRRTVVFSACVGHSVHVAELFRQHGVAAEHCDATATPQERKLKFGRFRTGETQVLCNVDLATYGFDLPDLDCVVLARPTKSLVRYLQSIGRGLRASPGKTDCLVLDHAGSVYEHGYADEERHWTLEGVKRKEGAPKKLTCEQCKHVFSGSLTCPACGYHFEALAKEFHVVDGELVPFKTDEAISLMERSQFYAELLGYANSRGYKPGWAAYAYKTKHHVWPPRHWNGFKPIEPSLVTMRFVKYMNIRRAKRRQQTRATG